MSKIKFVIGAALCGLFVMTPAAFAADHIDSPTVVEDPASDITDLFAWMNDDASSLNLVMDIMPNAGDDATFSTAVQYVFDVYSAATVEDITTLNDPSADVVMTTIVCQFYAADGIECWAGDDSANYVVGDPSDTDGITSADEGVRVFAGLRNDPFFMEFVGFQSAIDAAIGAATNPDDPLVLDAAGCPDVADATSALLVNVLQGKDGEGSNDPTDTFAGQNVLSLVLQVDVDLVNSGGALLGVTSSTRTVPAR